MDRLGSKLSFSSIPYRKDKSQSDSMDLACELVKLPWIYRKALLVLNQLEVMLRDCLGLLLGLHWDCHQWLSPLVCRWKIQTSTSRPPSRLEVSWMWYAHACHANKASFSMPAMTWIRSTLQLALTPAEALMVPSEPIV